MLAANRLPAIRTIDAQIIAGDVTSTGLATTTIDLVARVISGGIEEIATKTGQIGDTATVKKASLIGGVETETLTSAGTGTDQDPRRAPVGSDTRRGVAMMVMKTEAITVEEVLTEATGIARLRLAAEATTATSPLLRRLIRRRRSQQRQIPPSHQLGHPRHLSLAARR